MNTRLRHKQHSKVLAKGYSIQWNLFTMDTLGPIISGSFLLLYRGFSLSELKVY